MEAIEPFLRRMLHICSHLIRKNDFFVPPSLLRDSEADVRRDYYARAWDKVLIKWRDRSAIKQALAGFRHRFMNNAR